MSEWTISANSATKQYLSALVDKLKQDTDAAFVVLTTLTKNNREYLNIACKKEHEQKLSKMLKDMLAEILATSYKKDFLRKKLNISSDSIVARTLLSTMSLFDSNHDKKLIKQCFAENKIIAIDGVINFAMGEVTSRWNDVVALTKNTNVLFSNDTFLLDFLSFLKDSIPSLVSEVRVFINDNEFTIMDKDGRVLEGLTSYSLDAAEESLAISLVAANPSTVTVFCSCQQLSDEFVRLLNSLFCISIVTTQDTCRTAKPNKNYQ